MNLMPVRTGQFKKDVKKAQKSKKDLDLLKAVMIKLITQKKLESKYKDHKLTGNYKDRRECHIESDWLLIYKLETDRVIFERLGSHSELFK